MKIFFVLFNIENNAHSVEKSAYKNKPQGQRINLFYHRLDSDYNYPAHCDIAYNRRLAELFKVFGDTTRIKILYALFEAELCVGDIAQLLNLTQTAVSHQLRILKTNKLVKFRREGKVVFYSLSDDHVRGIIDQGIEHIEE